MRRAAAVALIGTVAAGTLMLAARDEPAPPHVPTSKQTVRAINKQRVAYGLHKLRRSLVLTVVARTWSVDQAARGVLEHTTDLLQHWRWAGETLYRGPGGPVRAWMNSPPHRAILLSPIPKIVGVGRSGDVWTARFAAP